MRRVISFLLSIVMVFSMLPVSAFAADVQTEETTAVTETVEQTTAPVTEATAEPSTEMAMEPSEEAATEAQTEAATEAVEETVPEPVADQGTYVPTVSLADSDELLEGWLYRQFYGDSGASFFGVAASAQLNIYGKKLYDGLKTAIQAVAAGSQTSTVFEVDVSAAGGTDVNDFQLDQVIDALLHDCPYELYWYDKTDFTTYQYTQTSDGVIYSIIVTMPVVADLRGSGYTEDAPVVDVTLATEAADAAAVAQEIVAANAGKSVYEKIVAFKGEICDLTSYNDEAAASMDFSTDADPWQLLWVFDGDASTTVVCEGYSKAFQYLCDLDGTIDCYTVTGVMTSPSVSGGHMWNIVTLNGANYLVDVTNSDSGTAGSDGSLFLNGGTGSVSEGYTFSTGGGNILFTYDDAMTTLWGSDGILVLSETAYDPDSVPEETEPEETVPEETEPAQSDPQTEFLANLEEAIANGDDSYYLESDLTLTGDLTIDHDIWIYICNGSITVPEGCTLTIGSNACIVVIDGGSLSIAGTLNAEGDLNLNFTRGSLTVSDGAVWNVPDQSVDIDLFASTVSAPAAVLATLYAHANATTAEEVKTALEKGTTYSKLHIGVYENMDLDWNMTIPGNTQLDIYNASGTGTVTVTVPAGCTLTNNGLITVGEGCLLLVEANASLVNNQSLEYSEGTYVNNGTEVSDGIIHGVYGSNVTWSYDPSTGTLTISGTGAMQDKSGDVPWSDYMLTATKLVIEDGITAIGKAVFELHSALESVTIADSVTAIGDEAFQANASLSELKLSSNLQSIGSNAFESCAFLSSVTLPEYVTTVGSYAFYRCINLTEIRFPSSITAVGDYAVGGCEALKTVTFVGMPPSIGDNAFSGVTATVNYPANAGWMDVNLQNYGGSLTWVKEVVTSGSYGSSAYWNYDADTKTLTISGTGAMQDKSGDVPWSDYQQYATKLVIEDGITGIGKAVFELHSALESVTIADSVTAIGDEAFQANASLSELKLSSNLQSIGSNAFESCAFLSSVTLPEYVTTVGSYAFYSCINLTVISFPSGIVSIGDYAMGACEALKTVTFDGTPPSIGSNAFSGVTATVSYPADAGWTSDMLQNYGGTLTWVSYGDAPVETEPAETEAPTYTLYFNNSLTGTVVAVAVKDGGTPEYVPAAETVAGYDFMGWYSGENGTGIQILDGDTWTSDMGTDWYAYYVESAADTLDQEQFLAALEEAAASDGNYYLTQSVTVSGELFIDQSVWIFVENGGSITVPADCTLTIGGNTHMVVTSGGSVTVNGTLNAYGDLPVQITAGSLTVHEKAAWNTTTGGVSVTLNSAEISVPDSVKAMLRAAAYPTDCASLEAAFAEGAAYAQIGVSVEGSIILDRNVEVPEQGQLSIANWSGVEESILTVSNGTTLTNYGYISVQDGCSLVVDASGKLVNYGYISVEGDGYVNSGIEENNGTIEVIRDITNVEELVAALAEAGAEASDSYYPTVYLNNALTLENGDTVTIPSYVTLMLNDCLTMESGSSLTIQQAATLMTGVYDADALIVNTGASLQNYGQLYLDAGYATFADGTYTQYQGGMVDLYPDATADGLDKGLIDYNISFSTAEELEQGLTQVQLGEYGSYTLSVVYGTASIALSGSYEIPANTAVDIYNGTNLELLSGTDVTNYGTIYLFGGAILTIPEDALLTNNGAIYNYGGTINGTVTGNQPGTGGYNETITVSDPDSLKAELEADSGTDIYLSGEIALTANLTVNSSSTVCIPGGASLVVPSGKTLTIKSNVYIYGGSIVVEKGGKLAVSGNGWIQNMSGVITNEGTITVSASSGSIWEYISYGASSTGIDKSKLHGVVFVQSTDDVLAGLAAAAEGYSMVEIVTEKSFALTESVTIPENVAFETTGFDGPVTVIVPWGVTLTNDGNVLIFENSMLLVRLGGSLVNNGYMEVLGTYTNNGVHSGGDPIVTGNGFVDIGAPECGEDLTYDLENGVLTVSGTGDMYDYANEMAPWYDSDTHLLITEVAIEEGVTSISHSAFARCANLEKVTVASTVTSIGVQAFQDCTALTEILFRGGVPEIDSTAFTGVMATAYYPGANATWTADKLANYGGSLTWVPVYELDQTYLDHLIDNAPLNGDGVPMVSEDITIAQDAVLLRDSQVLFTGSITVPTGVTLTIQSEVLLAGQLLVEEGGAVALENISGSDSEWISLVDVCGMQIDGTLTVGELCSFIVNDGAESVFGENSVINNYGTFCAEWNGIIRSGGIINNYNFVNILNRMTVGGELNNFGYLNVEAPGDGQLTIDGLLINHGEMAANAGTSVYVNGKLNNNGFINHFKAEDESVTGYFVVEGTLVNEQTGEMYLRDWVVVRNTVENYGDLYTSSMFQVESGVVKNLNRSVDKRGYLITENTSEFLVQGKLENSGDIEHFGYMEMDSGTADIGGTFNNHGVVGLGHFYGGTMNLTGTLYNEGELWVNHCVMDDVLYDGILNIDGELINTGMLGISGEANLNGALTNNGNATVAGETAVLAAAEGAVLNGDEHVRLGTFGTLVNISDSNVVLQAEVTSEEELVWALNYADEHDYIDEQVTITQSIACDGVTGADNSLLTELVVPDAVWLHVSPEYGELVFPAGTKLINNGMINIDSGAALVIEEDAELVNNSRIDVNDGWLIMNGRQSGEGTMGVPNNVTVTTEAELQAAVAMGVPNICVQSTASYAARTVSELTLTKDLTIPAGTQVVMLGVNLVVPENITLAIEGSVVVTDGSNVTVNGALENNAVGETGLQLVSGSLTFGETGSYTAAAGAETAVGNDFVINNSGEEDMIPSDAVINLREAKNFADLQTQLTEAENGQPYRIQVNSSFYIEADVTVHANVELIICEDMTLSVPANIRLYNAGTITVQNGAELYINGQYSYVELDGVLNIAEYGTFTTEFPAAESMTLCADGKTGSILLQPGREVSIAAVILPEEASAQTLVWDLIQETEVVSLDGQTLTALAEGTALLRVTATDGSGLTAELAITVSGYGIEITGDSHELPGGKSIKLEAVFLPDNLSDTSIVWSLAEGSESFATLKAKGNTATVTAQDVTERQTITVLAEAKDGSADPAHFQLTIIPKAKSITLFDATYGYDGSLPEGVLLDEYFDASQPMILKAMVDPAGASAEISWKAFNPDVAYIVEDEMLDAGCVYVYFTGEAGKAKFTATTTDGSKLTATWNASVVEPVSVEAVGNTELELTAGQTVTLKINNAHTGKAINVKHIDWYISEAMDADGNRLSNYGSVLDAKGKLTTKNVTGVEHLVIYGDVHMDGCYMGDVCYNVKVYPKTTTVELYQGNELVNGKTLALDSSAENPSLQLSALQLPLDARNGISWKSSSEKIATVQDGVVTFAGKTGTVTITATADDSGKKATVKVEAGAMTRVITAGAPAATLLSGKSMTLTAETVPAKPTKSGVTWTIIEGAEYAKVSGSKLTAKPVNAPRQVTLVATSKDAAKVVSNPVTVTILPKTAETLNLMVGNDLVTKTTLNATKGDTFELSAWMFFSDLEKDAQLTDVTWVSKKPTVATVSTGKDVKSAETTVTVVGTGSTVITATGYNSDGKKVTATVTVKSGILSEGVKVTSDVFTVGSGKSITLKAETIPAKPTTRGVVWSLAEGDEAYAKLSASGKLTAAKGLNSVQTVTVIVQAKDGASAPVEIPVTITPLATGVDIFHSGSKVNGQTMEWPVDKALKLTAKVYPFYGYGVNRDRNAAQSVTWKSSNSKILAIDARTGEVTFGAKTGTVTITATANDGSGKKATFKVKTIVPVRELEIRDGVIAGGKTLKLSTLITKINADATNKKLDYEIIGGDGADFVTLTASGELKAKKVTATKWVEIKAGTDKGTEDQDDDVFVEFKVAITPATTKIHLDVLVNGEFVDVSGKTLELEAGYLLSVQAYSDPDGAYGNYTWKISNVNHACLLDEVGDENLSTFEGPYALVEGITPGKTVTLTATANDGTGKKATVKIKVVEAKPR